MRFVKELWPGLIISLAFLVVGVITLSDYGLATDSVIHILRGQAYFHLFTTGINTYDKSKDYSPIIVAPAQQISDFRANAWELKESFTEDMLSEIKKNPPPKLSIKNTRSNLVRDSFYKSNYWNAQMFELTETNGHPPLSDILASVTNNIFYEHLGIFPDVDAYNFYALITGAIAIFLIYLFTYRNFGLSAAVISSITLCLYPFFLGESHFNIKDVPEMAYFTGVVISFYFWVLSDRKKWFFFFMVFSFLAIGTKLNILFAPLILIPWLYFVRNTKQFKLWFGSKLVYYLLIFVFFNALIFFLSWPALWTSTFDKLISTLIFYKDIGTSELVSSPFKTILGIDLLGIILVVTTVPIITLILFISGFIQTLRRAAPPGLLVLLWFFVPLLRTVIPHASIYASLRQFLEFLPAEAIIVGIGGSWLISNMKVLTSNIKPFKSVIGQFSIVTIVLVSIYTAYLAWINISYHPNENLYFNELAGGPSGAMQKGIMVTWQSPNDQEFKQAVLWLNAHAEQNAKLAFLDGSNFSISPLWLRKDIEFGSYLTGNKFGGEYIMGINYYPNPPSSFSYGLAERFLNPVYKLNVHGATILKIWKNDYDHVKTEYRTKLRGLK